MARTIALGEAEGFVKTVFDAETGASSSARIMIGGRSPELIQGFRSARALEGTEADLQATIFPHPTLVRK